MVFTMQIHSGRDLKENRHELSAKRIKVQNLVRIFFLLLGSRLFVLHIESCMKQNKIYILWPDNDMPIYINLVIIVHSLSLFWSLINQFKYMKVAISTV